MVLFSCLKLRFVHFPILVLFLLHISFVNYSWSSGLRWFFSIYVSSVFLLVFFSFSSRLGNGEDEGEQERAFRLCQLAIAALIPVLEALEGSWRRLLSERSSCTTASQWQFYCVTIDALESEMNAVRGVLCSLRARLRLGALVIF